MAIETYTLQIEGNLQGQYRLNTLHFQGNGVDTNDTEHAARDLIDAWVAHLQNLWLLQLPSSYYLTCVYARRTRLKPSCRLYSEFVNFSTPGLRGADAVAQQTCPCIFCVPPMGVVSGCKIYLPAVSAADISNNGYVGTYITAMQNFMSAAIGGIGGAAYTWKLGIYSHKLGSFNQINSYHFSPFIGFIHKRKLQSGQGKKKKKH